MPSCPFVHQIFQLKVQKVLKSGAFKNEGIHEVQRTPWNEALVTQVDPELSFAGPPSGPRNSLKATS
jgi:hypothetical protein